MCEPNMINVCFSQLNKDAGDEKRVIAQLYTWIQKYSIHLNLPVTPLITMFVTDLGLLLVITQAPPIWHTEQRKTIIIGN